MFLDWASHLHLLAHDPSQNILRDFSLPVKKIMVSQVVTFLLEGANFKTLTSASHVIYAMETCGQGFSLPIEEEDSITKVINLYQIWMFDGKGKRPAAIDDDPQFFYQKMISHFSLLFDPRAQTKELVEKHASLCSRVLDLFSQIGRSIGSKLSTETWELFLKLLIAITDIILRPEALQNQEVLQRRLCPQLLKVLFELWLLSRTRNPDLWLALKLRVHHWTHHMALIMTWKVTCFALTKRSASILYGPSEGSDAVTLKFDEQILTLNLEEDYVFYSWHRMLNIVGNPNYTIHNPAIYLTFISGVELLVNQYLKIGISRKEGSQYQRYLPPTGNTILHIFGSWLFDSVHLDRSGFEEGTAVALKIISAIVAAKYKTDLLPVYIASYYSSLQIALSKEGRVLLAAITSSSFLFTYDIKGIRSLVPYFIGGIQRILSKRATGLENVMPIEQVRRSCLMIFSTLICLPNHLQDTRFMLRAKDKQSKVFDLDSYSSLKKSYTMILTDALTNEVFPANLEMILQLCQIWQVEDIEYSSEFTRSSITIIVRKLNNAQNSWIPEVSLLAIKSLSSMSKLYFQIENAQEIAVLVVSNLCKYVQSLLLNPSSEKVIEDIVIHLYKCITDWIMTDQWLIANLEARSLVLKTIVLGLLGKDSLLNPSLFDSSNNNNIINSNNVNVKENLETNQKKKKEKKKESDKNEKKEIQQTYKWERIKEMSQISLTIILNHIGNFPTASGASVISTLAKEEEILLNIMQKGELNNVIETREYIRYFITDDRLILCVIDRRYDEGGPRSCVIARDKSGRYAWDIKLTHFPYKVNPDLPIPIDYNEEIPICASPVSLPPLIDFEKISNVSQYLSQNTKSALKLVENQVQNETNLLQHSKYNLNHKISLKAPDQADPYIGDCKIQQSRVLLSHLGLLALENRDKFFPLTMNESFFTSLKALDALPERDCIKVSVVYIRRGQIDEEFLSNEGGSLDYQEFIASLGWGVKIKEHRGYQGNLEPSHSLTGVTPYWSNYSTEILFHVTTLMGNSPNFPDHLHKKRQILGSIVVIVWAEDSIDFQPQQTMWARCRHNVVFVVISPLAFIPGLYFVKVISKNEGNGTGPMMDGAVVSKQILAYLIRETSISVYKKEHAEFDSPFNQRSTHIENIYQQFKKEGTLEQFYSTLFTSLSSDQIGPLQIADLSKLNINKDNNSGKSKVAFKDGKNKNKEKIKEKDNSGTPPRNWGKPLKKAEATWKLGDQRSDIKRTSSDEIVQQISSDSDLDPKSLEKKEKSKEPKEKKSKREGSTKVKKERTKKSKRDEGKSSTDSFTLTSSPSPTLSED